MTLYTERNNLRDSINKTTKISLPAYNILFRICKNYQYTLSHLFYSEYQDTEVGATFTCFDENSFHEQLLFEIPTLFRNDANLVTKPKPYDEFDEYSILDLIEYQAQNMERFEQHNMSHKWAIYDYVIEAPQIDVFSNFQKEVNDFFNKAGLLYQLTDEKNVERITDQSDIVKNAAKNMATIPEEELQSLLKQAISHYSNPRPASRQDSVEKLWDAFERTKTLFIPDEDFDASDKQQSVKILIEKATHNDEFLFEMLDTEFKKLSDIGNGIGIRHHETTQSSIPDSHYYDYLFARCISLLTLCSQYLDN
ncbi:hypothetical protein ACRHK7_01305 [Weissella tructae]|uniref:hypothetical protein n=1 Tax=Weissella tructae TaxID=887702 RepID=UPI003D8D1704